jgi:hypothetical protein
MNDVEFENFAKRVADAIVGHDSEGNGYMVAGYSKHNGHILMRMAKGKRSNAVKSVDKLFTNHFKNDPRLKVLENDMDAFYDQVFSHLFADGFDVEWIEEELTA